MHLWPFLTAWGVKLIFGKTESKKSSLLFVIRVARITQTLKEKEKIRTKKGLILGTRDMPTKQFKFLILFQVSKLDFIPANLL